MRREDWIDACRFYAILVIMVTHFLAMFLPAALALWEEPPASLLLGGLTGKFSVAFFFVLLGYFAGRPRAFRLRDFGLYALRRYGQFSFFVLLSTLGYLGLAYVLTWLLHTPDENVRRVLSDGFQYNLLYLLRDAFLLEDNYNGTLWCMRQLFAASLLCRLLGCLPGRMDRRLRAGVIALVWALSLLAGRDWVWLGAAALGALLRLLPEDGALLRRPAALAVVGLAALACIKAPLEEGLALYALQGIGAFLLGLALLRLPRVQRKLATPPFPRLGRISMGLFVAHTPVNCLLASSLWPVLEARLPKAAALPAALCLSLALSVLAAATLHRAWNLIQSKE